MITPLFSIIAISLYLAAGFLVGYQLYRQQTVDNRRRVWFFITAGLAVIIHSLVLVENFFADAGLNFGVSNAVSLLAWLIVLLLLVAALSRPVASLGAVVFPFAALAVLLEMLFPTSHIVVGDHLSLKLHILISIIAYSVFTIAAMQAMLLAVHHRHLHNRHPGGFVRVLPPLQTMEALLFQMIGLGFVLQSLSLISGFVFLEDMFAQHLAHKTVLSIMAWLVFAVLLWGHRKFGWRGKRAIWSTMMGFIFLLLAYVGSKIVMEIMLGSS